MIARGVTIVELNWNWNEMKIEIEMQTKTNYSATLFYLCQLVASRKVLRFKTRQTLPKVKQNLSGVKEKEK